MRPIFILVFLINCLLFSACTEEQRVYGREAEQAYVDLLYALYQNDKNAALTTANVFNHRIQAVRKQWHRPIREEEMDKLYFHLENAEWIYAEMRESIEADNLELAIIQLDRATYELFAADPASFQELYIGNIYGFFASWMEVDYAVSEADLCTLQWREFRQYAKGAQKAWRGVSDLRPSELTYPQVTFDSAAFADAKASVSKQLDAFLRELKNEDQCGAQLFAKEVTSSVWHLMLLFGTEGMTATL